MAVGEEDPFNFEPVWLLGAVYTCVKTVRQTVRHGACISRYLHTHVGSATHGSASYGLFVALFVALFDGGVNGPLCMFSTTMSNIDISISISIFFPRISISISNMGISDIAHA